MSDFEKLVEPHRERLRLHCYRMLGSSNDAEDMVQETLARAFRSRDTLQDAATARAWLYRIATNVCLDELQKRPRRARGPELGPPHDPERPPAAPTPDHEWIEPCPSAWVVCADPGAEYSARESIALAFVAALQVLTPAQRAVLLLRDVVGLSAVETAKALESSVSAVNSSLHRARITLEARVGPRASWSPDADAPVDRALLARYLRAWESGDLDTIVSLLHAEATLSMPPVATWIAGRDAVARFFSIRVCVQKTAAAQRFRTVLVDANGRAGVGFYRIGDDDRVANFFAIHSLEFRDGLIAVIDHNMSKSAHMAFHALGLPRSLAV